MDEEPTTSFSDRSPLSIHLEEIKDLFRGDVLSQILYQPPLFGVEGENSEAVQKTIAENQSLLRDLTLRIDAAMGDMLAILAGERKNEGAVERVENANAALKRALERLSGAGAGACANGSSKDFDVKAEE